MINQNLPYQNMMIPNGLNGLPQNGMSPAQFQQFQQMQFMLMN